MYTNRFLSPINGNICRLSFRWPDRELIKSRLRNGVIIVRRVAIFVENEKSTPKKSSLRSYRFVTNTRKLCTRHLQTVYPSLCSLRPKQTFLLILLLLHSLVPSLPLTFLNSTPPPSQTLSSTSFPRSLPSPSGPLSHTMSCSNQYVGGHKQRVKSPFRAPCPFTFRHHQSQPFYSVLSITLSASVNPHFRAYLSLSRSFLCAPLTQPPPSNPQLYPSSLLFYHHAIIYPSHSLSLLLIPYSCSCAPIEVSGCQFDEINAWKWQFSGYPHCPSQSVFSLVVKRIMDPCLHKSSCPKRYFSRKLFSHCSSPSKTTPPPPPLPFQIIHALLCLNQPCILSTRPLAFLLSKHTTPHHRS